MPEMHSIGYILRKPSPRKLLPDARGPFLQLASLVKPHTERNLISRTPPADQQEPCLCCDCIPTPRTSLQYLNRHPEPCDGANSVQSPVPAVNGEKQNLARMPSSFALLNGDPPRS